jgi:hypothetical protein
MTEVIHLPEPPVKTAWEGLRQEYRSEVEGWSVSGEFFCNYPGCGVSIGKNLKDERPITLAMEHLAEHKETT